MLLWIDVWRAAVTAYVVQRARRDDAFQRFDGRERGTRAGRKIAVWLTNVANNRLFKARRLSVPGECRPVDPLKAGQRDFARRALRKACRRGAGNKRRTLFQKSRRLSVAALSDTTFAS